MGSSIRIVKRFTQERTAVLYPGDCLELLSQIPTGSIQLIVTSPPYNLGKEYEKKLHLDTYLEQQAHVISECYRVAGISA